MGESELIHFDACIPYHPKDSDILDYCIQSMRTHLRGLRTIYIISETDPCQEDTVWISESRYPFTKSDVQGILQSTTGREGWYFQQLLKLYSARVLQNELLPNVLWIDSDVVICKPITFFDTSGAILLDWKETYYDPYFPHIQRVLGDSYSFHEEWLSGIADHMMVRTNHLEEVLQRIESQTNYPAWEGLLRAVDPASKDFSGMSEFEILYIYMLTNYPSMYIRRQLKRKWATTFHDVKTGLYDMVIFHLWYRDAS
jgi:hypothetical protein